MLLVQYGYIFLVLIFLLLFSSPEGSENKETKISELGKYISYCTLSRAITITYYNYSIVGPWSNGYQCGMRIPRLGFNSQRVPDPRC